MEMSHAPAVRRQRLAEAASGATGRPVSALAASRKDGAAMIKLTAAQRRAQEEAEAAKVRRREEAVRSHPPVKRDWPHALYHFEFDPGTPAPGTPQDQTKAQFTVGISLGQLVKVERERLLRKCASMSRPVVEARMHRVVP
jgi:hypothetical protein